MNLINAPYASFECENIVLFKCHWWLHVQLLPSGESLQQNGTNTEITPKKSPLNQELETIQVANNDCSTSPVQQEEVAVQESSRTSSKSDLFSDRTLATTNPDNEDFGRVEEIGTIASSAAATDTPERALTGGRQGEDIALEVKHLNHVNLHVKLYLSPLNYNFHTLTVKIDIWCTGINLQPE